jgi:hypothetical protein
MELLPPFSKQISFYVLPPLSVLKQSDSIGQSQFHCFLFHSCSNKQKLPSDALQTKTVLQFPVNRQCHLLIISALQL